MRIHAVIGAGLLNALFAGCHADSSPDKSVATSLSTIPNERWLPFKSEDERFAVSFPAKPTYQKSSTSGGVPVHRYFAIHEGPIVYEAAYSEDRPKGDAREIFRKMQTSLVQSYEGTLVKEEDVRIGAHDARAFSLTHTLHGAPGVRHVRLVLTEGGLYTLVVSGYQEFFNAHDAERFFRSLSISERK